MKDSKKYKTITTETGAVIYEVEEDGVTYLACHTCKGTLQPINNTTYKCSNCNETILVYKTKARKIRPYRPFV